MSAVTIKRVEAKVWNDCYPLQSIALTNKMIKTSNQVSRVRLSYPSVIQRLLLFIAIVLGAAGLRLKPALADAQPDISESAGIPAGITAEPEKGDLETHLRVQIFLDGKSFGPGKLDGQIGEFTRKAVEAYNEVNGIDPVEDWGPILRSAEKVVPNIYTTYTVKKEDFRFVSNGLPFKPSQQSKRRYMGYRSLAELIAERFHTDERFLEKINEGSIKNIYNLKVGSEVKVPNVTPFLIENVPKHLEFEEDPEFSERSVIVDTKKKQARFFEADGSILATFPITPGQQKFIHYGEWTVDNMVTTPAFRWDKSMLTKGKRSKEYYTIPSGPNNPVGVLWAGISKQGIGLHGTNSPQTIGRATSAGCIRFANWDAMRLSTLIRPGCKVTIK
jgi:lipoprotein-anchoring transpeptidase ErfK/SrfK